MSPPGKRDLLAAAWWTASLRARPVPGLLERWRTPMVYASAGLLLGGCADVLAERQQDEDVSRSGLDQQLEAGWNVGSEASPPLVFPDAQATDIAGGADWRDALATLTSRLGPAEARWAPYYNPTLFQSLEAPRNAELRAVVRPIYTPEMAVAFRRGDALLSLMLENGVCRSDVAIVIDVAGPEAVAVAAALAPCFDPVFEFANWPHPQGVVPAHLTLGAALYFLPAFERQQLGRPATAAPAFVVDRQRNAPYIDAAGQFDNRYLAGLPSREALEAAGIRHLLYITPDDSVFLEADDLNDDLVAIDQGGVDVKMLALSDFAEAPLPDWPDDPPCSPLPQITVGGAPPRFFFGGSPGAHSCFSFWYGWSQPLPGNLQALSPATPPRLLPRCRFHPSPRATFRMAGHSPRTSGGAPSGGGWFHGFAGRSGSLGRMHAGISG
jgi:hypothetical protein